MDFERTRFANFIEFGDEARDHENVILAQFQISNLSRMARPGGPPPAGPRGAAARSLPVPPGMGSGGGGAPHISARPRGGCAPGEPRTRQNADR